MTKKELVDYNIGLTFDFLRGIVKNPKLLRKIKNGATIKFVQKGMPLPGEKEWSRENKLRESKSHI